MDQAVRESLTFKYVEDRRLADLPLVAAGGVESVAT